MINVYCSLSRKRKLFRYCGDFTEKDLETPRKRKMFWSAYQKSCKEKNKRIRQLNQKSRNLQLKIDTLNKLVDKLEKQNKTNAICSYMLKVNNN